MATYELISFYGIVQVMSELSSLDDTTDEEQCFAIRNDRLKLWRRVRMIVHGVRGEARDLAGTVRYRSARYM